jgi:outer membrane biosynthesis protein TonB
MRSVLLALLLVGACGGGPDPILRNVPQPKTSVMAGAAAAVAGAATLAAPQSQANRVDEANKPDPSDKPIKAGPPVPADVLDRLDEAPPPPPEPPPSERPVDPKKSKGPATKAPKVKPQPLTPPSSNPLQPGAPIQ